VDAGAGAVEDINVYKIIRSPKGFLRVETPDILIADCDFAPYENNSSGYENYLVEVVENASLSFGVCSRIYKTHKGLRVIVCSKNIEVKSGGIGFLRSINADPLYVNMCMRDKIFSARLSPKPHRIGLAKSAFTNYPKQSPKKEEWFDNYEKACVNYATCKFKQSVPENEIMPSIKDFVDMHDLETKAFEDLPLA
jgi:hypothetical protein